VIKNIERFSYKGKKFSETGFHQKNRANEEYRRVLEKNGMKVIDITPTFYFMSNSIDKYSIKNRLLQKIISITWFFISRTVSIFDHAGFAGRLINFIIGAFLYFLDGIILKYMKNGPSNKLMLAEKL